ncbi:hypothetical protein CWI36_0766p0010, partial [Hamiltosporidium magnivora]
MLTDLQKYFSNFDCKYTSFFNYIIRYCVQICIIYSHLFLLFAVNSCICGIEINVWIINEKENIKTSTNDVGCYFLQEGAYSTLQNCDRAIEGENHTETTSPILYTCDNFLKFGFLEGKISEKQTKISIYTEKEEYLDFLYFLKITQSSDNILLLELKMFFNILRYLKVLNVERDENYCEFIKSMVFYVKNFDEEYFVESGLSAFLDYKHFDNFNIRDVFECFLDFYMFNKFIVYKTFHDYREFPFINSKNMQIANEEYKYIVNIFLSVTNFLPYLHSMSLFPCHKWRILRRLLYIYRLYIGDVQNSFDMNKFVYLMPNNINKAIIYASYNMSLIDKLHNSGFFKMVKNIKLIHHSSFEPFLRKMHYFKNTEILQFDIFSLEMHELNTIENLDIIRDLKMFKLIVSRIDYMKHRTPQYFLNGNKHNIFIDSSVKNKISNSQETYRMPIVDGYYKYLYGADLHFYIHTYESFNFHKFNLERIKRLKIDLLKTSGNRLKNYEFLGLFKSLKKLYLANIMLTNELLSIILRCNRLTSVCFYKFEDNNFLDDKSFNFSNSSIIYFEFKASKNTLNPKLFHLIQSCKFLQSLCFYEVYILYIRRNFPPKTENMSESQPLSSILHRPKLKNLKFEVESKFANINFHSSLNIFSMFYNIADLERLSYYVFSLYQDDLEHFSNFKRLYFLELGIVKNSPELNIFEKLINTNLLNTLQELHLNVNIFYNFEFTKLFIFRRLKILLIGLPSK